ncbi:sensor histidine kinase [Lewinella cohaerens]|uniref:sensor histidine kinase n=1 Tax=Lewinella cohaerens TaxID=70995 RepID=UPI00038231A5|nr:ATP-binding protein [Lewinella cohaerens]
MLKNSTPQQIALFVAFLITAGGSTCFVLTLLAVGAFDIQLIWLIFPLALFGISYAVTIYFLKNYIYRKIKLIYKTIHRQKVSSSDKSHSVDVQTNILEDVEKEVSDWAMLQEAEIAKYKSWAEYRRKFIGDISHELKTPIFNIQGYLHTLLDGGMEDETINLKFLQKAAKNVERLYTIVEDLSAISRLETGELILEMQVFDIRELAMEVIDELEFKARENELFLELKSGADQSFKVRADRESIRQVLVNLVDNSIKYGKDKGSTKLGFYDMDKYILVEVADNGIGIPKEHLPHVFDRFYRVDKSRSRLRGGSGLGLAIVKHIMEAHKQTINVRSTAELGSTFGFTLEKA